MAQFKHGKISFNNLIRYNAQRFETIKYIVKKRINSCDVVIADFRVSTKISLS